MCLGHNACEATSAAGWPATSGDMGRAMERSTVLVVGAAGDVGQGVVSAALDSGRTVIAAGRDGSRLEGVRSAHENAALRIVTGDVASESSAARLWDAASDAAGPVDAVVISVNAPNRPALLADLSDSDLAAIYAGNVLTHFNAVKAFLQRLPAHGFLIGIGGGTADFIMPKMAPISMGQAALRMMYRGLAKERKDGADLRELMIVSMVAGAGNRDSAPDDWIRDIEVGQHVCAILNNPAAFPKPILQLASREQAGRPDVTD